MRACGACGKSGHNKRTCKKGASTEAPPSSNHVKTEPASGPRSIASYASSRGENTFNLDEETLEANDWYLETCHPGYLERREARYLASLAAAPVYEDEEEDDNE